MNLNTLLGGISLIMMETIVAFGAVALVCLALFFTCGNSEETFTKIEDEKYRLWKKYYGTL